MAEIWATLPSVPDLDPRELIGNMSIVNGEIQARRSGARLIHVADARKALQSRDFEAGQRASEDFGIEKKHPIILIPGIVSTGLESWSTDVVSRGFFRKRLWVSWVQNSALRGTLTRPGHGHYDQSEWQTMKTHPKSSLLT